VASMPTSLGLGRNLTRLSVLGPAVGSLFGGVMLWGSAAPAGASGNLYVSPYGSDTANPCTSSADPCLTLQHAYNVSSSGNTINLAPGTFKGGVVINHNLNIVGSNSGGSLDAVTTTISRGGGTFDFVITVNNSLVNITNVVVDGSDGRGGGVDTNGPADVDLTNVDVVNNISIQFVGAGIENNSTLVMNGGSISNNSIEDGIDGYGGGLYMEDSAARTTLNGVTLTHNTATSEGGAIFVDQGKLKITGATAIHDNSAPTAGAALSSAPGPPSK
jgi:hypothetical protein